MHSKCTIQSEITAQKLLYWLSLSVSLFLCDTKKGSFQKPKL